MRNESDCDDDWGHKNSYLPYRFTRKFVSLSNMWMYVCVCHENRPHPSFSPHLLFTIECCRFATLCIPTQWRFAHTHTSDIQSPFQLHAMDLSGYYIFVHPRNARESLLKRLILWRFSFIYFGSVASLFSCQEMKKGKLPLLTKHYDYISDTRCVCVHVYSLYILCT